MIITKTPLRISFAGGGSDISEFYQQQIGATISIAIDKYIYVCVKANFNECIRLSYSKTEIVDHVDQLEHDLVKACLKMLNIDGGLEIVTMADIPSKGTGLGSSSSFTVGLLLALHTFKGEVISAQELADEACRVEIEILKKPIGKQDQFIASYGGFRFMEYQPTGQVKVNYVLAKEADYKVIENNLLLFYTGITRDADSILLEQVSGYKDSQISIDNTTRMVDLSYQLRESIERGQLNNFGNLLNQGWQLKKTLANKISNNQIDEMYQLAMDAGASGGKLLGAGGGGFLLVYAEPEKQDRVIKVLAGYKHLKIKIDFEGAKILFINH